MAGRSSRAEPGLVIREHSTLQDSNPQPALLFRREVWSARLPGHAGSGTELAQMMVEVLVHQNSPLLRGHASEEAMGM
jgi:hypothetical protein